MASADHISRLEAVCARLEAAAAALSRSGGAAAAPAVAGPSAQVSAWDEFASQNLTAFVDAANKIEGTKQHAEWAQKAFGHVRVVIQATGDCKKPSDADFMKFLQPIVDVINAASKVDNRSPVFNHQKAFDEAVKSLQWLVCSPPAALPKDMLDGQIQASEFNINRILVDAKKTNNQENSNYANSLKTLLHKMLEFVVTFYKTGLEWNPKGGDLNKWTPGSAGAPAAPPAAPAAPAAPPAAPAAPGAPPAPGAAPTASASSAPAPAAGGLDAVFAQIRGGGDGITTGLKRVTADMKTKNMKDVPTLAPKTPAAPAAAAPAPKVAEVKKEPKLYEAKGTWFCENYDGGNVTISPVQLKENVYIIKCKNCTINIPDKCKSIQVDSCSKVNIVFNSVVSLIEVFNSQRIKVRVVDKVPSVAIDKVAGASVELSRSAFAEPPTFITSNISEINIVIPGPTDEDDPIEIPVPEQYQTTLIGNKLKTEPVKHDGN